LGVAGAGDPPAAGAVGVVGTVLVGQSARKAQVEVVKTQAQTGLVLALMQEKRLLYAKVHRTAQAAFDEAATRRHRQRILHELVGRDEPDDEDPLAGSGVDEEFHPELAALLNELAGLRVEVEREVAPTSGRRRVVSPRPSRRRLWNLGKSRVPRTR
jgi:hypothetical protein